MHLHDNKIIVGRAFNAPEHAPRLRGIRIPHPAQQVCKAGLRLLFIVNQKIILADLFAQRYSLRLRPGHARQMPWCLFLV